MITQYTHFSPQERRELIGESATRMGVEPIIVEKDVWVSMALELIFTSPEMKNHFIFKGGTSLSKAFDAIYRFSEDIDLIMDWRLLGIGDGDQDPWDQSRSRTKQDRFNKSLGQATNHYLGDTFVPWLQQLIPDEATVTLSESVDQGIEIHYPAQFSNLYIPNRVLLEIGPLASWIPSVWRDVRPDICRFFPDVMGENSFPVRVTTAERTFWEKATIAHQVAHNDAALPQRYSRHYYDLVMLKRRGIAKSALSDLDLLRSVADFKDRFYPSRKARYDLAVPGTFRVLPEKQKQNELEKDYDKMQPMFFRAPPLWSEIITELQELENEINTMPRSSHV